MLDARLGVLGERRNDYTNAVASLQAFLGGLEELRGQALRERAEAEREVRAHPDSGQAHVRSGNVAFERFRLEDADESYARALELLPPGENLLRQDVEVARVYLRVLTREHAKGLELARAFLEAHPESPYRGRMRYYRGYLLQDAGSDTEARQVLAELVRDEPGSIWGREARDLLAGLGG